MAWLAEHGRYGGLSPASDDVDPCPGLTGAALETLAPLGQLDLARRWAAWLLSVQRTDGALPDAGLRHPSLSNTARAVRGLAAWADDLPECDAPARRAADYLASRIDASGRLVRLGRSGGSFEHWAPATVYLPCLAPLHAAARRWDVAWWSAAAGRAEAWLLRNGDPTSWTGPPATFVDRVEALIDLGYAGLALEALCAPAAAQRRDGSVPAEPAAAWTSAAGLARLAVVWYRLGQRERADRAIALLRRQQLPSGGFPGSWGRGAREHPRQEGAWAVRNFLDAARWQVETAFEIGVQTLPETIALDDGRFQALRRWLACIEPCAQVADVGCGPGRFARRLAVEFPSLRLVGIDPSQRLLSRLPANVEPRRGGLLRIPARDREFDGALAVESLEHALLPEHGVGELCRVVRPGGLVLVIDKHRGRQALSEHAPWEQWFEPEQVISWLSAACDDVRVEPIAHGRHPASRPLFLAWWGRRRSGFPA